MNPDIRVTYYCRNRPPMPNAVPHDGLVEIECYGERIYVHDIDNMAWGVAVYNRELAPWEVMRYELIREPRKSE